MNAKTRLQLTSRGRFALADGATEGYPSDAWARMLVAGFAQNSYVRSSSWLNRLGVVQQQWSDSFAGQSLPWYGQEQFAKGAFATFLGVVLTSHNDGEMTWGALAVGDTCLFHVRGDKLRYAFPLNRADQFGTSPRLIGSRSTLNDIKDRLSGTCRHCNIGTVCG